MALEPARRSRALRELRSLCAEVGANDPEAFAELVAIQAAFGAMVKEAAAELRTTGRYSWADLARPCGITRQSAHERWRSDSAEPQYLRAHNFEDAGADELDAELEAR